MPGLTCKEFCSAVGTPLDDIRVELAKEAKSSEPTQDTE